MKIFMMLIAVLSIFFIISCGGDDSTGGMSESEFYSKSASQTCEKGFECNIDYITSAYESVSECSSETTASSCTTGFTKFDGSNAQKCVDCAAALACDKFFDGATGVSTNCPSCNSVCVPK